MCSRLFFSNWIRWKVESETVRWQRAAKTVNTDWRRRTVVAKEKVKRVRPPWITADSLDKVKAARVSSALWRGWQKTMMSRDVFLWSWSQLFASIFELPFSEKARGRTSVLSLGQFSHLAGCDFIKGDTKVKGLDCDIVRSPYPAGRGKAGDLTLVPNGLLQNWLVPGRLCVTDTVTVTVNLNAFLVKRSILPLQGL